MPRLLIISTVVNTLEGFLLPFADHYRTRGWTVHALAYGAGQSRACCRAFNQVWDAPWARNPLNLLNNYAGARLVSSLAGNAEYDLVHVHTPVASFASRWALRSRRSRTKVVYTAHGFHFYRGAPLMNRLLYQAAEKRAAAWTDALVVINREDEQAALAWNILGRSRIFYIPGIGVDLQTFDRSKVSAKEIVDLRASLLLRDEFCVFLVLGELIPRKRPADVIAAFARTDQSCRLLFAGEGPLRGQLERQAKILGISERVSFLGQRGDIPCLLKASDALVLASRQEGLPRCVLEAMAMGVPVIGTRIRGTADLLACGAGLMVECGDIDGLHQAMSRVRSDSNLGPQMGRVGRGAASAYEMRRVLSLHDEMYEQVLAGSTANKQERVLAW